MADDLNRLDPDPPATPARPGDAPDAVLRRYLTDRRGGAGLGYYLDATTPEPAFRDTGQRLTTHRNDPQVIRDLVAIAEHRGWRTIVLRGETAFRREAWLRARLVGLEVKGYRPNARDSQDLERRRDKGRRPQADAPDLPPAARQRLSIVEKVVAERVADPAARARIVERAEGRVRHWLDRGARFEQAERAWRERQRESR